MSVCVSVKQVGVELMKNGGVLGHIEEPNRVEARVTHWNKKGTKLGGHGRVHAHVVGHGHVAPV